MPQIETMTLDEKLAISNEACLLSRAGDEEGYIRLTRSLLNSNSGMDFLVSFPDHVNLIWAC